MVKGHDACAALLENAVQELLLHPVQLDHEAQTLLLNEVEAVFTEETIPCSVLKLLKTK